MSEILKIYDLGNAYQDSSTYALFIVSPYTGTLTTIVRESNEQSI